MKICIFLLEQQTLQISYFPRGPKSPEAQSPKGPEAQEAQESLRPKRPIHLQLMFIQMAIQQLKNPSTVFRTINTTSFDSGSLPFLSALLATWRRVRMKVYSISGWTNWCTVAWDRWTQSHRRTEYRARPWTTIYLRCWDGGKHIMSTTYLVQVW